VIIRLNDLLVADSGPWTSKSAPVRIFEEFQADPICHAKDVAETDSSGWKKIDEDSPLFRVSVPSPVPFTV
jgi:hypothetical protein